MLPCQATGAMRLYGDWMALPVRRAKWANATSPKCFQVKYIEKSDTFKTIQPGSLRKPRVGLRKIRQASLSKCSNSLVFEGSWLPPCIQFKFESFEQQLPCKYFYEIKSMAAWAVEVTEQFLAACRQQSCLSGEYGYQYVFVDSTSFWQTRCRCGIA